MHKLGICGFQKDTNIRLQDTHSLPNQQIFSMTKIEKTFLVAGNEIKFTAGNFGFRADSAIILQQGETVVFAFVTVDSRDAQTDYFPLGVNYVEKHYAGGIISGSRFVKREARPSDAAVIKGRIIDRGMRPLFPEGFRKAVSVVVNVMAYDGENDPALLAANAASLAVHLSSVPFYGPVAAVRVGKDESGNLIVNPTNGILENSKLNAVITSTKDAVTQLEIEGDEIQNEEMERVYDLAFKTAKDWLDAMDGLQKEIGKSKLEFIESKANDQLVDKIKLQFESQIREALLDDESRGDRLQVIYAQIIEKFNADKTDNDSFTDTDLLHATQKIEKNITREYLLSDRRLSGRKMDEIREIEILASYLPRVHGSAMFRRGQTQALSITTLGSTRLAQISENFEGESEKRFMHHYTGPNYSFGSAERYNFYAGNREIGHGALVEKALKYVLPDEESFPYAIRVVSEILSQNGSTSMAATCGASLSLMDAGVPIRAAVAGISIGLITQDETQEEYKLLTDVQDVEDFYGDMDYKVCGTIGGITAIQMDTKLRGVKLEILKKALSQAQKARLEILSKMNAVLPQPRADLSKYAPRVATIKIEQDQIGDLIGPGGKTIKKILESVKNEAEVDINDDGRVVITAIDPEVMKTVIAQINGITMKPEIGAIYTGKVARIEAYGAFVDVSPAISGLVHVSEVADGFVKDVNKVLKVGQEVKVKLLDIDGEKRLRLSIKQAKE